MHIGRRTLYNNQTARFDHASPLDNDALRAIAPSIFAVAAHGSRSERFQPIPTINVIEGLRKENFFPVAVRQQHVRDKTRLDYTKHSIRLRRLGDERQYRVGDNVVEIILQNANDGSSCYQLYAGLFRIACLNSLVTQTGDIDEIKVKHTGRDIVGEVIEGTYRVVETAKAALNAPDSWGCTKLPVEARVALADAAHVLRFEDRAETCGIPSTALLTARRAADHGDDLWRTFNRVQENVIRGGIHGEAKDKTGHRRRTTMRTITGIDQDTKLNRALWMVGEQLFQTLKHAA